MKVFKYLLYKNFYVHIVRVTFQNFINNTMRNDCVMIVVVVLLFEISLKMCIEVTKYLVKQLAYNLYGYLKCNVKYFIIYIIFVFVISTCRTKTFMYISCVLYENFIGSVIGN